MANQDFDREIINPLERPLADDINQAQSQIDRGVRDILRALFSTAAGAIQSGFISTGLKTTQSAVPGMSVEIQPGLGFQDNAGDVPTSIGGVVGLDDLSPYKPLPLSAVQSIAVDAAPIAGQNRIDIVEVKADRRAENPSTRDILNVITGIFAPGLVNKTLAFNLLGRNGRVVSPANSTTGIGYKVGVAAPAGTEVAPATSPGYIKVCEIHVVGAVASILNADITDFRTLVGNWAFLTLANTWSMLQTFLAGISVVGAAAAVGVTATGGAGSAAGVLGTGTGAGIGVSGQGGPTSGIGAKGVGGAPNGIGVQGVGTGSGNGVDGSATSALADGVSGRGNGAGAAAGSNAGVHGRGGTTSGAGVIGSGGTPDGNGVLASGSGNGSGVSATGGGTSGTGVSGVGGAPNGDGVIGTGVGTGAGVRGTSAAGSGPGAVFTGNATRGPLSITTMAADPTTPVNGDVWINSTSAELKYKTGGLVYRVAGVNP